MATGMRKPSAASAPRSLMRCGGASRHGDTPRARSPSCAAPSSGCSAAYTMTNSHPAGGRAPSLRAGCTSCTWQFRKRGAEKHVVTTLLGIDCATQPTKTGLALRVLRDGRVRIQECADGSRSRPPAAIAADWLRDHGEVLVAPDALLGRPRPLPATLPEHRASQALKPSADELFSRGTDVAIWRRLHKQPLEVHSNNADRD